MHTHTHLSLLLVSAHPPPSCRVASKKPADGPTWMCVCVVLREARTWYAHMVCDVRSTCVPSMCLAPWLHALPLPPSCPVHGQEKSGEGRRYCAMMSSNFNLSLYLLVRSIFKEKILIIFVQFSVILSFCTHASCCLDES